MFLSDFFSLLYSSMKWSKTKPVYFIVPWLWYFFSQVQNFLAQINEDIARHKQLSLADCSFVVCCNLYFRLSFWLTLLFIDFYRTYWFWRWHNIFVMLKFVKWMRRLHLLSDKIRKNIACLLYRINLFCIHYIVHNNCKLSWHCHISSVCWSV